MSSAFLKSLLLPNDPFFSLSVQTIAYVTNGLILGIKDNFPSDYIYKKRSGPVSYNPLSKVGLKEKKLLEKST
jgi:hypothetical protein